jgi:hypothetical protein
MRLGRAALLRLALGQVNLHPETGCGLTSPGYRVIRAAAVAFRRAVPFPLALIAAVLMIGCGGGSPSQDARDRVVNEAMQAYREE